METSHFQYMKTVPSLLSVSIHAVLLVKTSIYFSKSYQRPYLIFRSVPPSSRYLKMSMNRIILKSTFMISYSTPTT